MREVNIVPGTIGELFRIMKDDQELKECQIDWARLALINKLGAGQFGDVCLMELEGSGMLSSAPSDSAAESEAVDVELNGRVSGGPAARGTSVDGPLGNKRQLVAVKRLLPASLNHAADVNDFRREIKLLHSLRHPNVVAFKGWGFYGVDNSPLGTHSDKDADSNALFLAEECCAGGSLSDLVNCEMCGAGWRYGGKEALSWLLDIAKALEYLHDEDTGPGIVLHRDLKLANVLLATKHVPGAPPPAARVVDFGIAKPVYITPSQDPDRPPKQPATGSIAGAKGVSGSSGGKKEAQSANARRSAASKRSYHLYMRRIQSSYQMTDMTGSVPYMAPEVIVGGKYGRRVDVFAWAIIAYELFMKVSKAQVCTQLGAA